MSENTSPWPANTKANTLARGTVKRNGATLDIFLSHNSVQRRCNAGTKVETQHSKKKKKNKKNTMPTKAKTRNGW